MEIRQPLRYIQANPKMSAGVAGLVLIVLVGVAILVLYFVKIDPNKTALKQAKKQMENIKCLGLDTHEEWSKDLGQRLLDLIKRGDDQNGWSWSGSGKDLLKDVKSLSKDIETTLTDKCSASSIPEADRVLCDVHKDEGIQFYLSNDQCFEREEWSRRRSG